MSFIKLKFTEVKSGRAFDRGCRGMLSTSRQLSEAEVIRIREYWAVRGQEVGEGDVITIPYEIVI